MKWHLGPAPKDKGGSGQMEREGTQGAGTAKQGLAVGKCGELWGRVTGFLAGKQDK